MSEWRDHNKDIHAQFFLLHYVHGDCECSHVQIVYSYVQHCHCDCVHVGFWHMVCVQFEIKFACANLCVCACACVYNSPSVVNVLSDVADCI